MPVTHLNPPIKKAKNWTLALKRHVTYGRDFMKKESEIDTSYAIKINKFTTFHTFAETGPMCC